MNSVGTADLTVAQEGLTTFLGQKQAGARPPSVPACRGAYPFSGWVRDGSDTCRQTIHTSANLESLINLDYGLLEGSGAPADSWTFLLRGSRANHRFLGQINIKLKSSYLVFLFFICHFFLGELLV